MLSGLRTKVDEESFLVSEIRFRHVYSISCLLCDVTAGLAFLAPALHKIVRALLREGSGGALFPLLAISSFIMINAALHWAMSWTCDLLSYFGALERLPLLLRAKHLFYADIHVTIAMAFCLFVPLSHELVEGATHRGAGEASVFDTVERFRLPVLGLDAAGAFFCLFLVELFFGFHGASPLAWPLLFLTLAAGAPFSPCGIAAWPGRGSYSKEGGDEDGERAHDHDHDDSFESSFRLSRGYVLSCEPMDALLGVGLPVLNGKREGGGWGKEGFGLVVLFGAFLVCLPCICIGICFLTDRRAGKCSDDCGGGGGGGGGELERGTGGGERGRCEAAARCGGGRAYRGACRLNGAGFVGCFLLAPYALVLVAIFPLPAVLVVAPLLSCVYTLRQLCRVGEDHQTDHRLQSSSFHSPSALSSTPTSSALPFLGHASGGEGEGGVVAAAAAAVLSVLCNGRQAPRLLHNPIAARLLLLRHRGEERKCYG